MPQSRHRKITKAKKRPRGSLPIHAPSSALAAPSSSSKNNTLKIVAIAAGVIVLLTVGYLLYSRSRDHIQTTASGLKYEDIVEGTGPSPTPGKTVTVNYTGTLESGKKFDSSFDHGKPYEFVIGRGNVIKGWDEGLMTMKVGGKRKLIVKPELGYGRQGNGNSVPPNATLIFEVELLGVK